MVSNDKKENGKELRSYHEVPDGQWLAQGDGRVDDKIHMSSKCSQQGNVMRRKGTGNDFQISDIVVEKNLFG